MKSKICELILPNKQKMNIKGEGYASNPEYIKRVLAGTKAKKKDRICVKHGKRMSEYLQCIPAGFDIETTTVNNHGYMYIWQMAFGDFIIYGRTWQEWLDFMAEIETHYDLGTKRTYSTSGELHESTTYIMVWIANLGFEFQFIGKKKNSHGLPLVREVFADNMRRPLSVKACFTDKLETYGFIFRDALRVGSLSLASLAKDYCTTQKMVGDLDYSIIRNRFTSLDDKEIGYTRNDVVILQEWATWFFEAYVKTVHFNPMTKTGIIREAVKQECKEWCAKNPGGGYKLWLNMPSFWEYQHTITWLFRGGYTHSNFRLTNIVNEHVHGYDFTSSYPAVMLQETYPVTQFQKVKSVNEITPGTQQMLEALTAQGKAFWADIRFYGVRAKTTHSIEQIYKIHEFSQYKSHAATVKACGILPDNGRILCAGYFTVTLNELDFDVYKDFYEWDEMEVLNISTADKGPLPEFLTKVVKYFYKQKNKLKKQGLDDTAAYVVAKQMVNGLYGLCVQKIHFDTVGFNDSDGWFTSKPDLNDKDQLQQAKDTYIKEIGDLEYINMHDMPKRVLNPFYGIWITSHARRRLLKAVRAVNEDSIYCDTDSIYLINNDKHKAYFDAWNAAIIELNKKLFGNDFSDLGDLGTFDPVEIKGTDHEGKKVKSTEYTFKTLGAKRYIKWDIFDNVECTIAGLPKKAMSEKAIAALNGITSQNYAMMVDYAKKMYRQNTPKSKVREFIVNQFTDGMNADGFESLKKRAIYNDDFHAEMVVDAQGHKDMMAEDSSICIVDTEFSMSLEEFYKDLVTIYREERSRF